MALVVRIRLRCYFISISDGLILIFERSLISWMANGTLRVLSRGDIPEQAFFLYLPFVFCYVRPPKVTNKIMFVIFSCMALVTTLSLVGYIIFQAEYESKLYYLCYDYENAPVPLFR